MLRIKLLVSCVASIRPLSKYRTQQRHSKLLGRGLIIATYKPKLILCVRPTTDKMLR